MRTKQAALPRGGLRQVVGLFPSGGESADTHAQRRLETERRQDQIESIHAQARIEYHERFRARIVGLLGDTPQAREPHTIADLETLTVQVARATGTSPPPKAALRALSRDGRNLRDEVPVDPSVEERKALEPRVDLFRERAVQELSDCAPEYVSKLESVPAYHPAAFAVIPYHGDPAPLRGYVEGLLRVINRAIKDV